MITAMRLALFAVALAACVPRHHAREVPPAGPDQTVAAAMTLVCDAKARAEEDPDYAHHKSDILAKHLTDGIGNEHVLETVELWKTNGIQRAELDKLVAEAKLAHCALRDAAS
jgi:hypothetical protein